MPRCIRTKRRKIKACMGDFDTLITLKSKTMTPPVYGSVDFDEAYATIEDIWANVETREGKIFFDGVGRDITITHVIIIPYVDYDLNDVWVSLNRNRVDIVHSIDIDNRGEYYKLLCSDMGLESIEANKL